MLAQQIEAVIKMDSGQLQRIRQQAMQRVQEEFNLENSGRRLQNFMKY
ncbi:MAG: hypothetical protein IPJ74_09185 [Saprospiraceae bacterium]|nr:hypothetical protein [Saprospiraceae bacterium]